MNIAGARAGDLVSLSIPTDTLIKGAAVLYLIPVIGMLVGALSGPVIGHSLALEDTTASILFSFTGLIFGFLVTALLSKKMSRNQGLTPQIDRIITANREPFKLTASNFRFQTHLDP
jgi:sigma-E factor negative regulatory protein RseC